MYRLNINVFLGYSRDTFNETHDDPTAEETSRGAIKFLSLSIMLDTYRYRQNISLQSVV